MEQNKEIKELTTEHLAMEVLKQEQRRSKALIIGLSIGLAVSGIATVTTAVCGVDERKHLVEKNYQNDCDWRELFSDYDFISQDGEGINSINDGTQGDLNNGAESKEKERQE